MLGEEGVYAITYANGVFAGILLNEYMRIKCTESEKGAEAGLQGELLDELGTIRDTELYYSEKIVKTVKDWYQGILDECRGNQEKIAVFSPCLRYLLKKDLAGDSE